MKLYTFVVHYLQMCMKAYGCCPKFKRGDNSTWKIWKKGKSNSDNIWTIWKKGKLNSEKI
jgi:hypothetical protein